MIPRDRLQVLDAYARAAVAFDGVGADIRGGGDPWADRGEDVAEAIRDLVDFALAKPTLLLETLSAVRYADGSLSIGYAARHAANTCVYAILLGAQLGLVRRELAELGEVALFADVALAILPDACTERATALPKAERKRIRASMLHAAQLLLADDPTRREALQIIVAFEHHAPYRARASSASSPRHPYARIVAVADVYDALRSRRPWRTSFLPAEAFASVWSARDGKLDPIVVEAMRLVHELEVTDDRMIADTEVRTYVRFDSEELTHVDVETARPLGR